MGELQVFGVAANLFGVLRLGGVEGQNAAPLAFLAGEVLELDDTGLALEGRAADEKSNNTSRKT
jgi:hypothetical protein